MPANLTPQYIAAEERYRAAKTAEEKLVFLEEMLATIPKHKGTEKMQGEIRKKMKKLKSDSSKKSSGRSQFSYHVEKEGAAQVVLAGFPNTGKSSLLCRLTNAKSEVADYPYTTHKAIPGMMVYDNVRIQLIDTPAISPEFMETWIAGIIRNADGLAILVDLAGNEVYGPLEQMEAVIEKLESCKIKLVDKPSPENQTVQEIKTMIIGMKGETDEAKENFRILADLYGKNYKMSLAEFNNEKNACALKREIFEWLDILRVYSKAPGGRIDREHPFIFNRGSTVMDMAESIHKDFAEKFKYARIWGARKYNGQMVEKSYELQDEDVIEIHAD